MVDFRKLTSSSGREKPTDPVELYDSLDRAHDKGPLRPAQAAVLSKWHADAQRSRDVIVKLHTGQGKTLIGLLMLQSRLNAGKGPALYLCPNRFLIDQTCEQAKQFGITTVTAEGDLPHPFLESKAVLVTTVQKLFNGLTKFGLGRNSLAVGTLLMDDAHAGADEIRDQCRIRIPRDEQAYSAIKALFDSELEAQGAGTYADICNAKRDAFLPIPYWAWIAKESDVARLLSKNEDKSSIKFVWPLLKDVLGHCHCVISGAAVEIECPVPPLDKFGSYWKAGHRIFMSATVTDDAFLVKGLQLAPEVIQDPLSYDKEKWSGEKMILLPSLIHDELNREAIVEMFGRASGSRKYGVVALAPSFARTADWKAYGAHIAERETVFKQITSVKAGAYSATLVLVNRYDGIDLPDDSCRILIFDSKPYTENLHDSYQELCRPESDAVLMRAARTIEQGLGRSVRGEKDYSVVMVIGADLVRLVRDRTSRRFFSPQTDTQVGIGLEVGEIAARDVHGTSTAKDVLQTLIQQCLGRDDGWKGYYIEKMQGVVPKASDTQLLQLYKGELEAERELARGNCEEAANTIQELLDKGVAKQGDKGWYLQEMARYIFKVDRHESQRLQTAAHGCNRLLLKPASGVKVTALEIGQARVVRLMEWVKQFDSYLELEVAVSDIAAKLSFGTRAEKFESALHALGVALGFAAERPDKEWKEGPDNLWALDEGRYLLWECKNEVDVDRSDVNKSEAEQLISSSAWFEKHYVGRKVERILVHPASLGSAAAPFPYPVHAMRPSELKKFVGAVKGFFRAFRDLNLSDLSDARMQQMLVNHRLTADDLLALYTREIKEAR